MKTFLDANILVSVLNKEYPLFSTTSRILSLSDRNNFVLYHSLGTEKGLTYSVGANTRFHPYRYDSFDTSLSYRQLMYKDWLFGTWTIGADFPKDNHYKDEKFFQFKLDLFFKEKK